MTQPARAREDEEAVRRTPSDPAGPTGRLATWLAGLRLADVPAGVQARAKAIVLDGIACALVGAQLPWSRRATELVCGMEGEGTHLLIGHGRRTTAPGAALLNGTYIQGFELDDFHPFAPLHSASLVLPALFAAAERAREPVSGREALLACIAGFETGPRVGLAVHGGQMLSRGWHSGAVFGTHAAAATAGKLLGLTAGQFEDALGLAATQSAGLMAAQYEAMSKRMHHGFSARNGLYAAHLAAGGYTGIQRVFEREYGGFCAVFGEGHAPEPEQVAQALGERWETERIVVKRYAAMGALHAPLDCLFELLGQRRFAPEEVKSIEVDMAHAAWHHGWWALERPITPIAAQMNVGYALAAGTLDGAAMVRQFAPARIGADDVWALIPKIVARHDPAFDEGGPLARGTTRMKVTLADGSVLETFRTASRSVAEPLTNAGVREKFFVLCEGVVEPARSRAIADAVESLEHAPDLRGLLELLAAPVKSPFEA